jgi:hypothetical protein
MTVVVEREENAYTLGVQAGLWGYPLAHRVEAFPRALAVKGLGYNSFQRFERLKTAEDRFVVTPNNLTIDAYAIIDVKDGPLVVFVPKLAEPRWFIVQLGDAFDDVILNVGGSRQPVPGAYLLTGPDYHGRIPGDMIQVKARTNLCFAAVRVGVNGSADLPGALAAQAGFHVVPLHRYLIDGIANDTVGYGPINFPALSAPKDLELFDMLGAAMHYMLPVDADVADTFVQGLATIGLSVGRGFDWQSLDESVHAGLRRAAPMVERIIDERWSTMSETVNGWRGSLASGRCSYDWSLNAANAKNQIGTELSDQVVYVNTRVDANDQPLDGANGYVLHFEPGQTPPVAGMWNLAMYDDTMLFIPTTSTGSRSAAPPTVSSTTGRVTHDLHPARPTARGPRCQLAAGPGRLVQPDDALLHPPQQRPRQELPPPRRQADIAPSTASARTSGLSAWSSRRSLVSLPVGDARMCRAPHHMGKRGTHIDDAA